MKQLVRQIINQFGYDIVRFDSNRLGKNPLIDMARFSHTDKPIIFDVGANIGQSIQKFQKKFPRSTIHSFEASPTIFETLERQVSKSTNVHLWNFALGSSSGQMNFLENSKSVMSSFLPLGDFGWGKITKETLVEVKTIDQFCYDENIERIDILKSDTQGFELQVFKGAEYMIQSNKIGVIYCEINFREIYQDLPTFTEIYDFLKSRDFLLVSFYKFYYINNLAGWTDALFIHKSYLNSSDRLETNIEKMISF